MRLDRFISNNSVYSRSDVKRLIKAGRVSLNAKPVSDPSTCVANTDKITIDDDIVCEVGQIRIMMHKPAGYVCATKDSQHPTVMDLTRDRARFAGSDADFNRIQLVELQIVGRLDLDTTGLLLLTNDGAWNHSISSPNSNCAKQYLAQLSHVISQDTVQRFQEGLHLEYENYVTKPASLEIVEDTLAKVTISEGKYHQVKRMFAACGNNVENLHRAKIGKLGLDQNLTQGNFRLLTAAETV